jgi:uncharacterized protein YegJ (DUF2314 family)
MNHRVAIPIALALLISVSASAPVPAQSNAPPDKPVASSPEQLKKLEDAMAPYVKQAQETLPGAKKEYLAGLPDGQVFYVTIRLYDPSKRFEQVFLKVTSWKGETIQGILESQVTLIHNYSLGEKLTCKESEVVDWTISKPDGTEEGNFVGKFLDTYQP